MLARQLNTSLFDELDAFGSMRGPFGSSFRANAIDGKFGVLIRQSKCRGQVSDSTLRAGIPADLLPGYGPPTPRLCDHHSVGRTTRQSTRPGWGGFDSKSRRSLSLRPAGIPSPLISMSHQYSQGSAQRPVRDASQLGAQHGQDTKPHANALRIKGLQAIRMPEFQAAKVRNVSKVGRQISRLQSGFELLPSTGRGTKAAS